MNASDRGTASPRADELPVWRLLDLGRCAPERAQAFVEAVAASVAANEAPNTLLVAQPDAPYISLGFHQSFVEELDPGFLERRPLPVLRRVEGGGTTYLDPDQGFYQLVYRDEAGGPGGPADLARFLAGPVRAARSLGLAAELRVPSDLVVGERKISGNAGGDWDGAHLLVGGFLGRADTRTMTDLVRLPAPGLRPIVRREVDRWMTSWERETGAPPRWEVLTRALVEAFRAERLFDARRGPPLPAEERRFETETWPRHQDPAWRELPPIPRAPGGPIRKLRIAGPRGILVFDHAEGEGLEIAIVDGSELREGFLLSDHGGEPAVPLPPDAPALATLRRAVERTSGFD